MANIVWIGLGHMGRPMAVNLLAAGHTVRGIEIDAANADAARDAGIDIGEDISEALNDADVVFTMLPSGKHVQSLLSGHTGVLALAGNSVVVDCSTIDIATARALHAEAQQRGAAFLDAPVSGGVAGAQSGSLTIMVGGEPEHFARVENLLQQIGGFVVHIGGGSSGQAIKIVNNMMFGIGLAAACEGAVLAQRLGLDPKILYDVVTRSSGDNWAFRTNYPIPDVVATAASTRGFTPGFTTELLVKDLALATAAGEDVHTSLATAHTALALFNDNIAAGSGKQDCASLVLTLAAQAEGAADTAEDIPA